MHAFDITLTDAEYERFSSIHTTVGGTLSAAIIAGMLVIFIKLYDNYNNKTMRDLKNALDIAKESERLPENGQESIQYLIETRSAALVAKTENEKLYASQSEKFKKRYMGAQTGGMVFIYVSLVLAFIGVTLSYAHIIGNGFFGFLIGSLIFFALTVFCHQRLKNMDKEMFTKAGYLSLKIRKSWWGNTKQLLTYFIQPIKSVRSFAESIFFNRGK